jgi:anti-sigma factor RsiW
MNCEKYENLLSDLVDGSLTPSVCEEVEAHLRACAPCAAARTDLQMIVSFCREQRGQYEAVPNERAMWLGISNVIEAELGSRKTPSVPAGAGWWFRLTNRSWQLTFPQLATSIAATIVVAVLLTFAAMRMANNGGFRTGGVAIGNDVSNVHDRVRQQEQIIAYWNKRVELNKARWTQQMREAFDRDMAVYDGTVNEAIRRLDQNPHDEVSEDVLNAALNDKIALLKEFGDL